MLSNSGQKQEFFLVDDQYYVKRSDPIVSGISSTQGTGGVSDLLRTMAPKVKAVLVVFHTEMWKLDMSNIVMHNETASGQHELMVLLEALARHNTGGVSHTTTS